MSHFVSLSFFIPLYLEARIIQSSGFVTKAKLYCSPRDGPINQDKLLWQGIVTLFRKPADQEDGGLVPQGTVLPELEFRLLLY